MEEDGGRNHRLRCASLKSTSKLVSPKRRSLGCVSWKRATWSLVKESWLGVFKRNFHKPFFVFLIHTPVFVRVCHMPIVRTKRRALRLCGYRPLGQEHENIGSFARPFAQRKRNAHRNVRKTMNHLRTLLETSPRASRWASSKSYLRTLRVSLKTSPYHSATLSAVPLRRSSTSTHTTCSC